MVATSKRVEELQEFFKTHNKSKEQKAHTSKVKQKNMILNSLINLFFFSQGSLSWLV